MLSFGFYRYGYAECRGAQQYEAKNMAENQFNKAFCSDM